MKVLFTICGRAGSKGIKNKNIRKLNGKILPFYSISVIDLFLKENNLEYYDIVVNTDSKELIELMKNNGLREVDVINREENLSGDTIGKIAVIQDCLNRMETKKNVEYDLIVDLDITSPLRTVKNLKELIEKHIETGADVTTSVTTSRRNPYFNQVMKSEKGYKKVIESNYTARQQAPEIFDMNASLYAYKPEYLRSGKGVLEGYVECIQMYDTGVLDLDHETDFELMELIAGYLFKNYSEFAEVFNNIK